MTPAVPHDLDAVADLSHRLAAAIGAADATASGVAAVAGGEIEDDGAPLGLRARPEIGGVEAVTVTRRWDSEVPNAAEIHLASGLSLPDVETRLGPSRALPGSEPHGRRLLVASQDDTATVTVSLNADGSVRSITVRRDI